MARIRMIKPDFFDDPDVADVSLAARLFFIGLWTQADKEGRLVDDMRRLKARIFPFDDVDVEALAGELHGKDMIRRYLAGEKHGYIWIRNFTRHQRPHPKEPASLIPPCENGAGKRNGEPGKETAKPSESGVLILDSGVLRLENAAEPPPTTIERRSPIQGRRRKDAAWEGPRVYVPQRCHSDFVALRNGAEAELFAWYAETSEAWTDGPFKAAETGPDMFAFWKARYAEKWPVPKVDKRIPEWAR